MVENQTSVSKRHPGSHCTGNPAAGQWPGRRSLARTLEYTLFLLTAGGGLALNELAIWMLTELCALHYLVSKILAGSSIFALNFLIRKHVLFR